MIRSVVPPGPSPLIPQEIDARLARIEAGIPALRRGLDTFCPALRRRTHRSCAAAAPAHRQYVPERPGKMRDRTGIHE
ncbi:MAG TPA: hypothetical protein VFF91_09330 [Pseudoxanthomonas sp.]|nr:hypothetical protein [Pseudoxanthomonas sp.]